MKKDLSNKDNIKEYAKDIQEQNNDLSKDIKAICQATKELYYEVKKEIINID